MAASAFVSVLILTVLCARMAQQMAAYQNRSVRFWLWLGAFAGPVAPILLAVMPGKVRQ
jgi:multidrug efflux pump subunit AcrB